MIFSVFHCILIKQMEIDPQVIEFRANKAPNQFCKSNWSQFIFGFVKSLQESFWRLTKCSNSPGKKFFGQVFLNLTGLQNTENPLEFFLSGNGHF